MTGAERLRQEGREEGRREGRREGMREGRREGLAEGRREGLAEGRREGLAEFLTGMLEDRFGPLPADARTRIARASAEALAAWCRRVLTAPTLDDVLAD